jgi:molybdenum cofactor biosynthesis protein MoaC
VLPRNVLVSKLHTTILAAVRTYRFENTDAELTLLPLAARRALDCAGRKLSLEVWQTLPHGARQALVEFGSGESVEVERVLQLLSRAAAPTTQIEVVADPSADVVPEEVTRAYGGKRLIPAGTWAALPALDRYALAKIGARGRAERLAAAYAEIIGDSGLSSHLEPGGGVRMVNIGSKSPSEREAEAEARVSLGVAAYAALSAGTAPKGDVLGVARIAAILAAKRTAELIPLCHQVALTRVRVDFELDAEQSAVWVRVSADAVDRTGVEMEALTAASVAALTIYDMLKGIDRGIEIGPLRVTRKSGGRTGDYQR